MLPVNPWDLQVSGTNPILESMKLASQTQQDVRNAIMGRHEAGPSIQQMIEHFSLPGAMAPRGIDPGDITPFGELIIR